MRGAGGFEQVRMLWPERPQRVHVFSMIRLLENWQQTPNGCSSKPSDSDGPLSSVVCPDIQSSIKKDTVVFGVLIEGSTM